MPSNIPSIEELQSYFNLNLTDKPKEEREEIEEKIETLKSKFTRILPDVNLTEEEEEIKEKISFRKLGIKSLDAFNQWLDFVDQRNQITSVFAYEPEVDINGVPFIGKILSVGVYAPERDSNGYLVQSRNPISGAISNEIDLKNLINLAIPPITDRNDPSSVSFVDLGGYSLNDVRVAGDTNHNPTKDFAIKQQLRNYAKAHPEKRIIEIIEVPIQDYIAEIKDKDGTVTQTMQLPVFVKLRVDYIRTRKTRKIQINPREYPRLVTTMQDSMNTWQQSSSQAMTLDAMLQKAALALSPEQLEQFLEDKAKELKEKIKNNTIN